MVLIHNCISAISLWESLLTKCSYVYVHNVRTSQCSIMCHISVHCWNCQIVTQLTNWQAESHLHIHWIYHYWGFCNKVIITTTYLWLKLAKKYLMPICIIIRKWLWLVIDINMKLCSSVDSFPTWRNVKHKECWKWGCCHQTWTNKTSVHI